jgi:hypothetical protein
MLIEVKLISVSTNDDVSRDARYITVKKWAYSGISKFQIEILRLMLVSEAA